LLGLQAIFFDGFMCYLKNPRLLDFTACRFFVHCCDAGVAESRANAEARLLTLDKKTNLTSDYGVSPANFGI
jgi:hypothetical protein